MSAPSAIAFATSKPLLIPPLAIIFTEMFSAAFFTDNMLSAVGIPHWQKSSAAFLKILLVVLFFSTSIHDVPPAPPTSIPETPAFNNFFAVSSDIPNPTSLLLETGCQFDMTELLNQIIGRIEFWYNVLYRDELENINREYLKNLYGINEIREFTVKGEKILAKITGIEQTGELVLELESGEKQKFGFKEIEFI